MMARLIGVWVLLLAVTLVARAGLIDSGERPPVMAENFDPKAMVVAANRLIAEGEGASELALYKYAQQAQGNVDREKYLAWLCLLVFDPRDDAGLPQPVFGSPDFPDTKASVGKGGRLNSERWGRFPLVVQDSVPFLLVRGYTLAGLPESGVSFLKRCEASGTFATEWYPVPTRATAEAAMKNLITSPAWKALKWRGGEKDEIDFLKGQAERVR